MGLLPTLDIAESMQRHHPHRPGTDAGIDARRLPWVGPPRPGRLIGHDGDSQSAWARDLKRVADEVWQKTHCRRHWSGRQITGPNMPFTTWPRVGEEINKDGGPKLDLAACQVSGGWCGKRCSTYSKT